MNKHRVSLRVECLTLQLHGYDFEIQYLKGTKISQMVLIDTPY